MSETGSRRMLLRCSADFVHDRAVHATVDAAHLLNLELCVRFVEDDAAFDLALLPFGREIRLPTYEWRPIDPVELAGEYRHVANDLRERLQKAARAAGITCTFEVVRGERDRDESEAVEILVRLPAHLRGGSRGPAVAVVSSARAPALASAAEIALAAHESLVVVCAEEGTIRAVRDAARRLGVPDDRIHIRAAGRLDAAGIADRLADLHERYIVLEKSMAGQAEALAAARHVPVLLL